MPDFPRYESKASPSTRLPSVGAPLDTQGQVTENTANAIGNAQNQAYKWQNAVDTIQKTTANANFKTGLLDIQQRAANDPNYNNSAQYNQEIEKLKQESLKGFSSKTAETETALNFGYESKVAQIQIDNLYKKKMIDVGQTSSLKLIDAEVNNPTETSLSNIKKELDTQVNAKIFGHEAAYKIYQKANDDLGVNRVNQDLNKAETPEQVEAIRQGLTSGDYESGGVTIDPEKKRALLGIADTTYKNAEKKSAAVAVEAQAQNRVATISGVASGQINLESLDISQISEYDPQLGSTLIKAKEFMKNYNPKVPIEEQRVSMSGVLPPAKIVQARNYAKSVSDVFMHNDNEKLGEFVLRELEKKGDGTTSSVKLSAFMQLAALKVKANNPQTPEDDDASKRLSAIKSGVKYLQTSNPYLAPEAISDFVVRNYLSGGSTEEQVMQEANSVLKDKILNKYKSVAKLKSLPNKIVDGEASVEDLQSGLNEYKDGEPSGDYADTSSD